MKNQGNLSQGELQAKLIQNQDSHIKKLIDSNLLKTRYSKIAVILKGVQQHEAMKAMNNPAWVKNQAMVSGQQLCFFYETYLIRDGYSFFYNQNGLMASIKNKNMAPYQVLIVDKVFFIQVYIQKFRMISPEMQSWEVEKIAEMIIQILDELIQFGRLKFQKKNKKHKNPNLLTVLTALAGWLYKPKSSEFNHSIKAGILFGLLIQTNWVLYTHMLTDDYSFKQFIQLQKQHQKYRTENRQLYKNRLYYSLKGILPENYQLGNAEMYKQTCRKLRKSVQDFECLDIYQILSQIKDKTYKAQNFKHIEDEYLQKKKMAALEAEKKKREILDIAQKQQKKNKQAADNGNSQINMNLKQQNEKECQISYSQQYFQIKLPQKIRKGSAMILQNQDQIQQNQKIILSDKVQKKQVQKQQMNEKISSQQQKFTNSQQKPMQSQKKRDHSQLINQQEDEVTLLSIQKKKKKIKNEKTFTDKRQNEQQIIPNTLQKKKDQKNQNDYFEKINKNQLQKKERSSKRKNNQKKDEAQKPEEQQLNPQYSEYSASDVQNNQSNFYSYKNIFDGDDDLDYMGKQKKTYLMQKLLGQQQLGERLFKRQEDQ